MIRFKLFLILGVSLIIALALSVVFYGAWKSSKQSYNRILRSNETLHHKLRYFKSENGQLIAENRVLQLKSNELASFLPTIREEVRNLGIKLPKAHSVSTNAFLATTPTTVQIRDSIIYDTVPVKIFDYSDGYFDIQGMTEGNQQRLNLSYSDTLVQVVYRGEREIPWLWIFSPRKLMQRVQLKNPNAQIEYTQHIEIE